MAWERSGLVTQKPRPDSGEQPRLYQALIGSSEPPRLLQHFHPESLMLREMYLLDFSKCQNPLTRKNTRDLCKECLQNHLLP